jgi:hypothetical protein
MRLRVGFGARSFGERTELPFAALRPELRPRDTRTVLGDLVGADHQRPTARLRARGRTLGVARREEEGRYDAQEERPEASPVAVRRHETTVAPPRTPMRTPWAGPGSRRLDPCATTRALGPAPSGRSLRPPARRASVRHSLDGHARGPPARTSGRPDRADRPARAEAQASIAFCSDVAAIAIRRGLLAAGLGTAIESTPSAKVARTFSASTPSGMLRRRRKEP